MREPLDQRILPSTPVERLRLYGTFCIFALGFIYISVGLAYRQVVQAEMRLEESQSQSTRIIIRPPARGMILDRNDNVLVDNRVRWSVKADLALLQKEFRTEYLRLLQAERLREAPNLDREKLQESARVNVLQGWLNKVWFVIDENSRKRQGRKALPKAAAVDAANERFVNTDELRKHLRDQRALTYTLVADLSFPGTSQAANSSEGMRAVARFIEQFPVAGPIRLESDIVRSYPYGSLAAHVLGYIKDSEELPPSDNSIEGLSVESLQKTRYTGKKGAAGIELSNDSDLRGKSGLELWSKTSAGYNQSLLRNTDPQQGSIVTLSLDYRIQQAAERALSRILDSQQVAIPGAAVMLDVHTGEILALASQPTFDPNRLAFRVTSKYYDEVEAQGGWLNRAIQGLYAPGSTFKVITAIAGMRNKIIDWDDILDCGPSLMVGNRPFPEHGGASYGQVDLDKMLAVSCNVWNYQVGLRLGIEPLATEARRFGLDQPLLQSGTDSGVSSALPYPSRGMVIPDKPYKEGKLQAGKWSPGDTANTSIGQGYLLTTPLHMACLAASLARGETRTIPAIIHASRRDGIHAGAQPIGLNTAQLNALRGGMVRCVEEGTAASVRIPGLPYAAKTGTSEYYNQGKLAHLAWIIGYAPAENPVVAFAIVVEGQLDTNTWGGKTAGPVARDMILTWAATKDDGQAPAPKLEGSGR